MSAEAEPVQQSFLSWILSSLGLYAFLLPFVGLLCFIVALIIVLRGKGPMAAAALVLVVHAPLLIGAFAALGGAVSSFNVIAMSDAAPKASALAEGISTVLVTPMAGIVLMIPGYATAAIGAVIRSMAPKQEGDQTGNHQFKE